MACAMTVDFTETKGAVTFTCICTGECEDSHGCIPEINFKPDENPDIDVTNSAQCGNKAVYLVEATGGTKPKFSIDFYCKCGDVLSSSKRASGYLEYQKPLVEEIIEDIGDFALELIPLLHKHRKH